MFRKRTFSLGLTLSLLLGGCQAQDKVVQASRPFSQDFSALPLLSSMVKTRALSQVRLGLQIQVPRSPRNFQIQQAVAGSIPWVRLRVSNLAGMVLWPRLNHKRWNLLECQWYDRSMFNRLTLCSAYFCLGLGFLGLSTPVLANPAAEKALEAKIQGQLEAVLGPGKAKVTVSGGSERARRQSRSVTHHNPQTAHERIVSETQAGVTRSKVERIYTYDQSESLATEASGHLTQKSVSVIYEPPKPGEDPENAAPPLDPALVETIVRTTARINESQGDQVHISQVKMDTSAYDRLRAEMDKARQGAPLWSYVLCGLGGITGGVGLGFFLARRRQRKAIPAWENPPVYPGILAAETPLMSSTNQALEQPRA